MACGKAVDKDIGGEWFDHGDMRIHYRVAGHGPRLVLFTSGTLGLRAFPLQFIFIGSCDDFNAQMLAGNDSSWDQDKYTMVSWCPPGYGHSRPPARNVCIEMNGRDAQIGIALMKHLKLTPFVTVGWSEGGRTALHMCHAAPKDVCKAVIMSAILMCTDTMHSTFISGLSIVSI